MSDPRELPTLPAPPRVPSATTPRPPRSDLEELRASDAPEPRWLTELKEELREGLRREVASRTSAADETQNAAIAELVTSTKGLTARVEKIERDASASAAGTASLVSTFRGFASPRLIAPIFALSSILSMAPKLVDTFHVLERMLGGAP